MIHGYHEIDFVYIYCILANIFILSYKIVYMSRFLIEHMIRFQLNNDFNEILLITSLTDLHRINWIRLLVMPTISR